MELSLAELNKHENVSGFSACRTATTWLYSWVHTRGRLEREASDGGSDVVVMRQGGFPIRVLSGLTTTSGAVFSLSGSYFVIQAEQDLLVGCSESLLTTRWLRLPADEKFVGRPVWASDCAVLFATAGGAAKRTRLFVAPRLPAIPRELSDQVLSESSGCDIGDVGPGTQRTTLFTAERGGGLLSWDHSPTERTVAVVHRRANAMLAEVVLVPGIELQEEPVSPVSVVVNGDAKPPRVVALDGRVEYCKPQVRFLSDGRLVARLNLVKAPISSVDVSCPIPPPVVHGLWLLDFTAEECRIDAVRVVPHLPHGTYDVFSGSYGSGGCGAPEGFIIDQARTTIVATVRPHSPESIADELSKICFDAEKDASAIKGQIISCEDLKTGKGCYIPVASSAQSIAFHFRNPSHWGDLWFLEKPGMPAVQLTHTMPFSLQRKLMGDSVTEVTIDNPQSGKKFHALLFRPSGYSKAPAASFQPLVWIHGGPTTLFSYDYNPLLSWLAGLGYLVCVPNFRGSSGFGVDHMDAVFGDGCGVADLSDCAACVRYLRSLADPQLDLQRGVGVAGHSWGGYLALMCMLRCVDDEKKSLFSCGVASAAISDWHIQQRYTEVRYYDYALMGGWVYEPTVAARARSAAPVTFAAELKAPLLVLHGEADDDVPFAQCRAFVEAAKRAPDPAASVKAVTFPGQGHGIGSWNTATQKEVFREIRDFLRINLKPWDFTQNPHGDLTAY